jgi:hypothetical protein
MIPVRNRFRGVLSRLRPNALALMLPSYRPETLNTLPRNRTSSDACADF